MSKMQEKNPRRKTILSTLPLQHWVMGAWRKFGNLLKKNPNVETEYGRRHHLRTFNQAVVNLWHSLYERSKMERILQSGTRGKKTEGSPANEKGVSQGSNQGVSQEEERKRAEHLKKLAMAKLFESQEFKYFTEQLQKIEQEALNDLVSPVLKPKDWSYENFTFYCRGELNVFIRIRDIIEKVISYKNKNALQD